MFVTQAASYLTAANRATFGRRVFIGVLRRERVMIKYFKIVSVYTGWSCLV